jgi:hypothetical protein
VGKGAGKGFNVNVPWSSKGMGDADYLAAFDLLLDPIITQFDPQVRALQCDLKDKFQMLLTVPKRCIIRLSGCWTHNQAV